MRSQYEGPSSSSSSSARQESVRRSDSALETAPLLVNGSSNDLHRSSRHSDVTYPVDFEARQDGPRVVYHSSDESYFLDFIMEKLKSSRFAYMVDKLAVESEPNLTSAQLMLNNYDLKPGMF